MEGLLGPISDPSTSEIDRAELSGELLDHAKN
jgi:hypothetical protein